MVVGEDEDLIARAERELEYAQRILASGAHTINSDEWLLIACQMIGAAEKLATVPADEAGPQRELFAEVLEDLRLTTKNFQLPAFLSASRAARRGNPDLFRPHPPAPSGPGVSPFRELP